MKFSRNGVAAVVLTAAAMVWVAGAGTSGGPAYVFNIAGRYEPKAWMAGRERFPAGASLILVRSGKRRAVAPGFAASADAAVSFDGGKVLFAGKRTAGDRWQIWESALDAGLPRRVVESDADCIRPLYVPGGKVAYTRITAAGSSIEIAADGGKPDRLTHAPGWYLTDDVLRDGRILIERADGQTRELFTVYPDGTGIESLRCDHGPDRAEARQTRSGDIVFGTGTRLARFTPALARQTDVGQPAGEVAGPVAEIAPGKWILAVRQKAGGRYGLFAWDAAANRSQALEVPAGANAIQPVAVAPRVPPREFPSALVETRNTGNLLCLNARDGRTPLPDSVKAVKLYTRGKGDAAVLLGEAPVERDGSFYVEVPADRPLRLELVDDGGKVVQAEHGWFWMRPSEQRICVGCHTGPERSPENRVPEVLRRSIEPVKALGEAGS